MTVCPVSWGPSVHAHAHFSSARQSLQCDTNKCLDVSVSLLFSHGERSSHGLVVLKKTSAPIVPHKASNADAAVAWSFEFCVCVRGSTEGVGTVMQQQLNYLNETLWVSKCKGIEHLYLPDIQVNNHTVWDPAEKKYFKCSEATYR